MLCFAEFVAAVLKHQHRVPEIRDVAVLHTHYRYLNFLAPDLLIGYSPFVFHTVEVYS